MFDRTRRRLELVIVSLCALTILLVARLVTVQIVEGATYAGQGRDERQGVLRLPDAPRGSIRDRNGFLLAGNRPRYAIEAYPNYIADVDAAAETLAPILQMPSTHLAVVLSNDRDWVILKQEATREEAERARELLPGDVDVRLWWERVYPHGSLTAHLLGFVPESGSEGFYGLEGYYDDRLSSERTQWQGEVGAISREPLPFEEGRVGPSMPGMDLDLTIDLPMQALAAEELARAIEEYQAESGLIVVMDPRTGAVLAMVSQPSYDPQRYAEYIGGEDDLFVNPSIGFQYEPGSVFKVVTMAAALDSGVVVPETTYIDEREIEVGGRVIYNWDRKPYGEQDMTGILVHSLNVGAAWLSLRMGPDVYYRYVRAFGFDNLTGVDLEGEVVGEVRMPGNLEWHDSDLGANAYGQGLAVTPIQMICAVAAVANEGRLMQPYLVGQQVMPDGSVQVREPVVRGQPISPETARTLTDMLVQAVDQGVQQAQVPGYRVAGKTGTAEIPVPGGYDPQETIASFVGYGPADDPQLIILVRLDRPQVSRWGGETAAVVFSRLASRLFPMMGIAPDDAL